MSIPSSPTEASSHAEPQNQDTPRKIAIECHFRAFMAFHFPVAKLARYAGQEDALARNTNPFALLTLACLQNRKTTGDMQARYTIKCKLIRLLFAHQWDGTLIRQFFMVIDWMMTLPLHLELQLIHFITALEEEQKMEYVSSIERIKLEQASLLAKQEGLNQGLKEGLKEGPVEGSQKASSAMLLRFLQRRFGELPSLALEQIQTAPLAQIEAWFDRAMDTPTLDMVFQDLSH